MSKGPTILTLISEVLRFLGKSTEVCVKTEQYRVLPIFTGHSI